jgi:hypothetical protein
LPALSSFRASSHRGEQAVDLPVDVDGEVLAAVHDVVAHLEGREGVGRVADDHGGDVPTDQPGQCRVGVGDVGVELLHDLVLLAGWVSVRRGPVGPVSSKVGRRA